jgi:hypothetical protein
MEQNNNQNPLETRNKILSILRLKGPSLPVQIARETGLNSLFAGAFLSELASDKSIKISIMKVGGSPLYFLPGQEAQLEKFHKYLPGKEKEAFLLLQKNKILQDNKEPPAIRVALRQLKDFAVPFMFNQEVFWRFHSLNEEEVKAKLMPKITPKTTSKPKLKIKQTTIRSKKDTEQPLLKLTSSRATKKSKKKPKEKSDFVNNVLSFLSTQDIEILEEKEAKKKEYQVVIRINSILGKIRFLLIAKDKKRITDNDLALSTQKSQSLNLPAFFLSPGEPNKKAKAYLDESSLVIFRQL